MGIALKYTDRQQAILNDYITLLEEGTREGVIDMAFYYALESYGKKKVLDEYRRNPDRHKREYISKAFVDTAYQYMLDCGSDVDTAIQYSFEIFNKTRGWWDSLKNKDFYDSKDIINSHKDHPKQKSMIREGTMDKVVMNQSRSANQFLRRASKCIQLSNTLSCIRSDLDTTNDKLDTITAEHIIQRHDIDGIFDTIGMPRNNKRYFAKLLDSKGFTHKIISDTLGVSTKTIQRYLREN